VGVDVVARLATVTVIFTLFIYALVIISAIKLRGHDEDDDTFIAPTWLLLVGILGNLVLLGYVLYDDPASLYWVAALLALGLALFLLEHFFGKRDRPADRDRGGRIAGKEA
jgi:amino acid transporter